MKNKTKIYKLSRGLEIIDYVLNNKLFKHKLDVKFSINTEDLEELLIIIAILDASDEQYISAFSTEIYDGFWLYYSELKEKGFKFFENINKNDDNEYLIGFTFNLSGE